MKKNTFIITTLFILIIGISHINAQENEYYSPIVVELFTSKGCPSCPPADKILEALAHQENIIALGCHVTYWNREQFNDNLSQDFCDMRQHGYTGTKGGNRIYTPQMVINGGLGFIGSHQDEVNYDLDMAKNNPINIIPIELIDDNKVISFSLPNINTGKYRIWGYGYKNTGDNIKYVRPVMSYDNLGRWNGEETLRSFYVPDADIDGMVILAQEGGYGRIVAAGELVLKND